MIKTDKRCKLTAEQKIEIVQLKADAKAKGKKLGDRPLAELYGVSRRTIQFLTDPAKLEANRELAKKRKKDKEKK
jgi:hypothetical protein